LISLILTALFNFNAAIAKVVPRPDQVVIVFIPGIYGSILSNENNQPLWGEDGIGEPGLSLIEIPNAQHSLFADVKFRVGFLEKTIRGYSGFNIRSGFISEKSLTFTYDWRKSNVTSASMLDNYLCNELKDFKKPFRIVFVAHSMGGLVLRHWIKNHLGQLNLGCNTINAQDVAEFIFVGTPHLGAMETVAALLTGKSSLERNPIYAALFTGGMAAYGITFESTYELLPVVTIAGPNCSGLKDKHSKLMLDIGTGINIPIYLNNIENWIELGIPKDKPNNISDKQLFETITTRIDAASKVVCDLNSWIVPTDLAAKMHFIVGELIDEKNPDIVQKSTWDSIEIIQYPGKEREIKDGKTNGDGTVPLSSAEPSAINTPNPLTMNLPVASLQEHSTLLDDVLIVKHIQRILNRAAIHVALMTENPLGTPISSKADWEEARNVLVDFAVEDTPPEVYTVAIKNLSNKAISLNISGTEIYRDAKSHVNSDKMKEQIYKAVGFEIASTYQTELNKQSIFWAHQNSSYSWLNTGNNLMAIMSALEAGKTNAELRFAKPDGKQLAAGQIDRNEKAWRSILKSFEVVSKYPDVAKWAQNSQNLDATIFEHVADFSTLEAFGGKI